MGLYYNGGGMRDPQGKKFSQQMEVENFVFRMENKYNTMNFIK